MKDIADHLKFVRRDFEENYAAHIPAVQRDQIIDALAALQEVTKSVERVSRIVSNSSFGRPYDRDMNFVNVGGRLIANELEDKIRGQLGIDGGGDVR